MSEEYKPLVQVDSSDDDDIAQTKEDPNYDPPPYTPQEGATPLQDMAPKPYSATDPVVVHPTAETFGTAFAPGPSQPRPTVMQPSYLRPMGPSNQSDEEPADYLIWSIINTLFCCWIMGIWAIAKSREVRGLKFTGQLDQARVVSNEVKKLNILTTAIGIFANLIAIGALGAYIYIRLNPEILG